MNNIIPNLGGYICVRNNFALDYNVFEAALSLMPICKELILCDSDSTDGTREKMNAWAKLVPGIKVINYPWPDPKGDSDWWIKWLNFARRHLSTEMQITLDADEVLDDRLFTYNAIRNACENKQSITVDRLNFWKDAHSLIPDGHCCGKYVTRIGPAKYEMPSDECRMRGERPILDEALPHHDIKIYHLGFLRSTEAFYAKAKVVIPAFFTRYDVRLEMAEKEGKALWQSECEFADKLVEYDGYYPPLVRRWLLDHNYEL
jgi:glycosyltransferase involved in cell wall biosynthesis